MSIPSTLIAGVIRLTSCGSMGARIVHSLWLIEADPHRGGSISLTLIGSRALMAYGDVDGPSAVNNRPWSRKCTARLLRRSDASASVHGCAGTHSVRLASAGSVG